MATKAIHGDLLARHALVRSQEVHDLLRRVVCLGHFHFVGCAGKDEFDGVHAVAHPGQRRIDVMHLHRGGQVAQGEQHGQAQQHGGSALNQCCDAFAR